MTGPETVAALPLSIRVGPFDMAIVKMIPNVANEQRVWGQFSGMTQEIRINPDSPTCFKAVDTFLHELSHAIFWAYGIEDSDNEERTVTAMGTAWTAIFRDNPWLTCWLDTALNN